MSDETETVDDTSQTIAALSPEDKELLELWKKERTESEAQGDDSPNASSSRAESRITKLLSENKAQATLNDALKAEMQGMKDEQGAAQIKALKEDGKFDDVLALKNGEITSKNGEIESLRLQVLKLKAGISRGLPLIVAEALKGVDEQEISISAETWKSLGTSNSFFSDAQQTSAPTLKRSQNQAQGKHKSVSADLV